MECLVLIRAIKIINQRNNISSGIVLKKLCGKIVEIQLSG